MHNRLHVKLSARRSAVATLATLAILTLPLAATAQPAAPSAAPPAFRSAMDGYQPYSEEKMQDWKQANDRVGQIGGWREYAREASRAETPDASQAAKPDLQPAPATGGPAPKAESTKP